MRSAIWRWAGLGLNLAVLPLVWRTRWLLLLNGVVLGMHAMWVLESLVWWWLVRNRVREMRRAVDPC